MEHHCSLCKASGRALAASTHYLKDCSSLSASDKSYFLDLADRALRNRLVEVEERDPVVSGVYQEEVEDYYELEPEVKQIEYDGDNESEPVDYVASLAAAFVPLAYLAASLGP